MNEQPFDVKEVLRPVWLRRRLLAVLAVLGLAVGVTYGVVFRSSPSATALILLPPSNVTSAGVPTRDVATEIDIATSAPVLSAAGRAVTPHLSFATVKKRVAISSASQDILQIDASAPTGAQAEALANAVARQFVTFVTTTSDRTTATAVRGLQRQSAALTQQVQQLQNQIATVSSRLGTENPSSPAGQTDTSLLGSLSAAQQQVSLQLDTINTQIVSTQVSGTAQSASGTEILQRATSWQRASLGSIGTAGVLGLLAGLVAGALVAALRERRDRRLFTRDEISGAIGVPVLGSLQSERRATGAQWRALFADYEPDPVDVWNLRRILDGVRPGDRSAGTEVQVVSFAGDEAAAAVGSQLAIFANSLGVAASLSVMPDPSLEDLRAVSASHNLPNGVSSLFTADPRGGPAPELNVHCAVVDAAAPSVEGRGGRLVLAVSAGFSSADALARLALAAADAGRPVDGVVIVNPYQGDATTGLPYRNGSAPHTNGAHDPAAGNGTGSNGAWTRSAPPARGGARGGPWRDDGAEERVGSFVSLRIVRSVARRHWRAAAAVALVGLVVGAGLHTVVPRKYAAESNLFLTEPATSDPAEAMANDVSLLQTRAVASGAMRILGVRHTTPSDFLKSYTGVAVSDAILSITYSAHSPGAAVSGASAVSRAFLAVRSRQLDLQTKVVVSDLQHQVDTLDQQVTQLGQNINALGGSSSPSAADEIAGLVNQRSEDSTQVSQLEGEIQQENLDATSVTGASEVLDPAAPIVVSTKKVIVMDGLSGLVGGLGVVLAFLVVAALLSDRVRSRAELAQVLGAPVESSVATLGGRGRSRLRRLLAKPDGEVRLVEHQLRRSMAGDPDVALAVVSVAAPEVAALAVANLAASMASEGWRVVMVDVARGRPLAALVGGQDRPLVRQSVEVRGSTVALVVGDDRPDAGATGMLLGGGELVLVLATLDPAVGAGFVARLARRAVAVVDVHRAGGRQVRSNAEMLVASGVLLCSAVAVDADPDDTSVGAWSPTSVPRHAQARSDLLGTAP
ncbi:MAG TPA: hypothetical protein VMB72_02185 [Acidimicrobiales bacterium]|nr:hypothetical protein [Acidimicrobiales bacterium]